MRILFVQPPFTGGTISGADISLGEPLALEILAANLPGHDVSILDMRLEPDVLDKVIETFKPQMVGTTAFTAEVYKASAILKRAKELDPSIITVIGGHHATLMPSDFDKVYIDVIVMGEGESAIRKIAGAVEKGKSLENIPGIGALDGGKRKYTGSKQLLTSLDDMPFPDRDLTMSYRSRYFRGKWKPVASVFSSRGCPFRCDFCAMWKVYDGKFRTRSASRFADELELIDEVYININDDNTLQNIKYAEGLYREIRRRGIKKTYKAYGRSDTIAAHPSIIEEWKSIGLELVLVGVEAFRDKDLLLRNKRNTVKNNEEAIRILHRNGVGVIAYFLVDQDFSAEDFSTLSAYTKDLGISHPVYTILTPFPGTDLFETRRKDLVTADYELFDVFHSVLPTRLPLQEFYERFIGLYREAYSGPENKFVGENMVDALIGKFMEAHGLAGGVYNNA